MEQIEGVTTAIVADSTPCTAVVPVASAVLAPEQPGQIPHGVPLAFWTRCEHCKLDLQYLFHYKDSSLVCPSCNHPFLATEIPLEASIGTATTEPVRRARKKGKRSSYSQNVSLIGNFEPEGSGVVQREGMFPPKQNEGIMIAQRQELTKSFGKASKDASFEKRLECHEIRKKSSPEDVYATLAKIPNLAREDLLKGFDILRCDNFEFRSLMALPMEMRKDWLLMQLGRK